MGLDLLLLTPGGRFPEGSETPPGGSWVFLSLQELSGMSSLSPVSRLGAPVQLWESQSSRSMLDFIPSPPPWAHLALSCPHRPW